MQREFREQRGQENQAGFHLNDLNPYLKAHRQAVTNGQKRQIFVPLCGKSLDLESMIESVYKLTRLSIDCILIYLMAIKRLFIL